MTNVVAAVVITIQTQWISHGVLIRVDGSREHVQRAQAVTNTTAIVQWNNKRHEMVLENLVGPITDVERRTPMTAVPSISPPPLPTIGPGPRLNEPGK